MKSILRNFPLPIITERLILRPPQVGDGAMVYEAVVESINELREYMPWACHVNATADDSEEFVRLAAANWISKKDDEPWFPLAIMNKASNEFIGMASFHHVSWEVPSLELGYWIRTSRSGKGLMTEAVRAMTGYAFREFNARRVEIRCDVDNTRSRLLAERCGFQLEAILKHNRTKPLTGEISDTCIYSVFSTV